MLSKARVLSGLAAAVLLWAAFFPGLSWLTWVALIPLFWALDGLGLRRGALLGGAFGFLFFLLEFTPLFSLWPFVGPLTILLWILLSLYGSLYFAAFGLVSGKWSSPLVWAGAWALFEAARASGPLGFTFGSVPTTLVGSPFVGAAAWGGPWLLSLAVAWTAGCLARGLRARRWLPFSALGPLLLLAMALLAPQPERAGNLDVTMIQPNIPKSEQLDYSRLGEHEDKYRRLLEEVPLYADLIVVPENALPWILTDQEYVELFASTARRVGAALLVGTGEFRGGRVYNTILAFAPSGAISGTYAKVHLVPFGEYVPARSLWTRLGLGPLIDPLLPFDQTPGEQVRPVGNLGIMICFESTFPGISQELVRGGAEVLITPTNDAWFGRTRLLWEHYAMGALRAAETGRAFLQAGQTGISGAWAPSGRELGRLSPWTEGVLTLRVPLYRGLTPYVRLGDGPTLGVAAGLILLGLLLKRRPRR